jgi:uncharacterized membrane protein YfcA
MDLLGFAALLLAGAVVGLLGGLMGIGGGLFAIPLLGVIYGLDQQHAQGTSLVMVVPNVAIGLWSYAKKGKLDLRIALALALTAAPVTFLGAHFATHVPSAPLRIAFAFFILAVAGIMTYNGLAPARAAGRPPQRVYPWPAAMIVGAVGGGVSGAFGVGGAVFAIPLLSFLFALTQAVAQGYGLALVAPGTLVGISAYALAGDIDWAIGIPLALGGLFTVPYGVRLAHRLPDRTLRLAFAGLMVISAIALLLRARG